jgi:hypothetical protein
MNEHEVGVVQEPIEVDRGGIILLAAQGGKALFELFRRRAARAALEVGPAPAAARLEHGEVVATLDQLGAHPAEKVGVAVIPVRYQRVAEDDDPHRSATELTRASSS